MSYHVSLLRSGNNVDVLHENGPWLGTDPGDGDLEFDVAHESGPDVNGPVEKAESITTERNILQLNLTCNYRILRLVLFLRRSLYLYLARGQWRVGPCSDFPNIFQDSC